MGISRDSRHRKRATGGKRAIHQKKRKYELGRPAAMTKLGGHTVHTVRTRGGNTKLRAIKLDSGSFSWQSEGITLKSKITNVVYCPTTNEYVRTNTITKGVIVSIDSSPFKLWYKTHYGIDLNKGTKTDEDEHKSRHVIAKQQARTNSTALDQAFIDDLKIGRVYALITSRPGQVGAANGYILQGKELEFYKKKMDKKRRH